jgi:hypothetical protein
MPVARRQIEQLVAGQKPARSSGGGTRRGRAYIQSDKRPGGRGPRPCDGKRDRDFGAEENQR